MHKIVSFFLFSPVFLLVFVLPVNFAFAQETREYYEETLEGEVVRILQERDIDYDDITQRYQELEIRITKGSLKGEAIVLESGLPLSVTAREYKVGDKLVISYTKSIDGEDLFFITDQVRRGSLLALFIIFSALAVVVGRFWGVTSLLGMAFTFLVIFKFILPQILSGRDPVLIAVLGSSIIIPVTFSLSHGLKTKTFIATVGTIITLIIVGILASIFVNLSHLSGFSAEEAGFLQFELGSILNMKGILLAGIIIATLGVLDDITISQASIVQELKNANSKYGFQELYRRGMNVGRDHIASLINTLVLVYTGASFPLLLLFINNPRPFIEIINYEIIAEEIVRTLVGSIGLILAVPITTALAAYFFQKAKI